MPSGSATATRDDDEDHSPPGPRPQPGGDVNAARRHGVGSNRSHPRPKAFASVLVPGYIVLVAVLTALGLLVTKLLVNGPVGNADEGTTRWLSEHRTGSLDAVTNVLSRSTDTVGAVAIAFVAAIVFAVVRHWKLVGVLVLGLVFELMTFLAVNSLVDRPRPDVTKLGSVPTTSSFPSGHSAAAVVIYSSVAIFVSSHVRRRSVCRLAWLVAVVMPLAVGFARVYRGMHHPLDIVAGLVMGAASVAVTLSAFRAAETAVAVAPADAGCDGLPGRERVG
jgi:membrane-associated phospholipid phosphatase